MNTYKISATATIGLLLLLLQCAEGTAQGRLDARSIPQSSNIVTTVYEVDPKGKQIFPGGLNQLWDISEWYTPSSGILRYLAPSAFPLATRTLYPDATVAMLLQGNYTFYSVLNGRLRVHGSYTNDQNYVVVASNNNNPFDTRPVEVVYNDRTTDIYQGRVATPTDTGTRTGTYVYRFDGTGIIRYNAQQQVLDVVRVVETQTTTDTLLSRTVARDTSIVVTASQTYTWHARNSSVPLIMVTSTTTTRIKQGIVVSTESKRKFITTLLGKEEPTTVVEDTASRVVPYPNPSTSGQLVTIPTGFSVRDVHMFTISGDEISTSWEPAFDGMSLRAYAPPGNYMLMIESTDGSVTLTTITIAG